MKFREWLTLFIKAVIEALTKPKPTPPTPPPTPEPPKPEPPQPQPNDPDTGGYDGAFLWKPESMSGGNLVILTPYQLEFTSLTAGGIAGRYDGRANGHRQHWRFNKPGAAFGKNVTVTGTSADGSTRSWIVPDGAVRWEKR